MIVLNSISKYSKNDEVYLSATVNLNGVEKTIWYSTDKKFENYITITNADSFILILFIYSIFNNKKFKSEVAVSKRLKYGLLEIMLPAFQMMGYNSTKKDFDFSIVDKTIFHEAKAVGTAMSFGVDSFHAYLDSLKTEFPVDTLTLFNAGAFGEDGVESRQLFELMKSKVDVFAKKINKDFVWVDTNLNEILQMSFLKSHSFRNFSCVLVLQKMFTKYYYASGLTVDSFKLVDSDTAYYDLLSSKVLISNNLELITSGLLTSRMQKTIFIADSEITYEELNVCIIVPDNKNINKENITVNCSKCFKCIRTMTYLDVIGKLDNYKNVFDLKDYHKNKNRYFGNLLYMKYRANNVFSKELFEEVKKRNFKLNKRVYFYALIRIFQPILNKIKHSR